MNILQINHQYLSQAFRRQGHRVEVLIPERDADPASLSLAGLVARAGFEPDLIILGLMGYRPLPAGLEDSPWPLAAVALDSCLNMFWLRHLAPCCDWVFTDQRDDGERLRARGVRAWWLPLSVEPDLVRGPPRPAKEHDLCFVGRVNQERLKRKWLLARLGRRGNLLVAPGEGRPPLRLAAMLDLFARSRVVLNENFFPGVTLRLFQGLASGSLVLTEACGNGLEELFTPGEHLLTFTPENLERQVARCLAHKVWREGVAARGREELLARHLTDHRAARLMECVTRNAPGRAPRAERLAHLARACLNLSRRYPLHQGRWQAMSRRHALAALEAAGSALSRGDPAARDPRALACGTLGRLGLEESDWGGAAPWLESAAQLAGDDPGPLFVLARLAQLDRNAPAARARYAEALECCPGLDGVAEAGECLARGDLGPGLAMALGRVAQARGRVWEHGFVKTRDEEFPETAAEWFGLAARQGGGAEALLGLGRCALNSRLPDQATQCFAQAAELLPADPEPALLASAAAREAYNPGLAALLRSRARALAAENARTRDDVAVPTA